MKDEFLVEARRLYDLGFAIHWLHPKSKRPVESGWTSGPRKSWNELRQNYRHNYNVGTRVGSASKIDEGKFLACIDVDVKTGKENTRKDAFRALKVLIGDSNLPRVISGAGHGSCHLYCVTAEPFKMITVEKNDDWEICVYSEGRQMVLPPSIHPSGTRYKWAVPLSNATDLPLLSFERPPSKTVSPSSQKETVAGIAQKDFVVAPVELSWLDISEKTRRAIVDGTDVEDRSAYLLPAASALVSAGCNANEVLTVLTDPTTYLGQCAYDHAKTTSRARAAEWLWKYTVKRVMEERDAVSAFEREAVIEPLKASPEVLLAQNEEWGHDPEASGYYSRGKNGALKPDYDGLLQTFEEERPFKTIADMRIVYAFGGTHYLDLTPYEIKAFAEEKFSPKPEEKLRNEFLHKVLANNVTRRSFFTESTEGKINFKNGILDLTDEENFIPRLLPHSEEYGFRGVLPYDFDYTAQCPVFEAWLHDVMLGDTGLMNILQEFMGYVIRGGEYRYHKALWLGGVGRNGKSTFVDLLKALIGAGNFSVISIKSLMNDKFAGAELDGKIANFSEETSPQELADSGPFKNLTGDGDIFVQKKYGDPYSCRNKAKLIMTYNQIPDIKDLSPGMLSRPLIIPFEKIIHEEAQDQNIKQKLLGELPGIFNFALTGWYRLEKQKGFTTSKKSSLALKRLKEESCPVFQWVDNYIESAENGEVVRATDLYALYRKTDSHSYRFIEFCRRMNAHPLMKDKKKRNERGVFFENIQVH